MGIRSCTSAPLRPSDWCVRASGAPVVTALPLTLACATATALASAIESSTSDGRSMLSFVPSCELRQSLGRRLKLSLPESLAAGAANSSCSRPPPPRTWFEFGPTKGRAREENRQSEKRKSDLTSGHCGLIVGEVDGSSQMQEVRRKRAACDDSGGGPSSIGVNGLKASRRMSCSAGTEREN